jgi:hypothetical protein
MVVDQVKKIRCCEMTALGRVLTFSNRRHPDKNEHCSRRVFLVALHTP